MKLEFMKYLLINLLLFFISTSVSAEKNFIYKKNDLNVRKKILRKHGVRLPRGFERLKCKTLDKNDSCFPSGVVQAIKLGGVYKKLWKAERIIDEEQDIEGERLLKKIMRDYPKNPKVYWLLAKNLFFRGERMPSEDVEGRDRVFLEGIKWSKKCIELDKNNINCLLHAGTLMGRRATNKGIIKFLFDGKKVEQYWLQAYASGEHYRFPSLTTSLGAVNYALGVFYRLCPDSFILNLFFGFRGNIDKSIKHIKNAINTNNKQVELRTELTAALFCKYEREKDQISFKSGLTQIEICKKLKPSDKINEISQQHCNMLEKNPKLGCGYSRDRQQETDEEKFKEQASK
jgi:hypothetical protein